MLCLGSLLTIGLVGAWTEAMVSLSVVVTSLGIPLGVVCARCRPFAQVIRPLLDAMPP